MTRQELIDNLGTIARSGTRAFGETLARRQARGPAQPDRPVRRRLLLGLHGGRPRRGHLRKAGGEEAWTWASDGAGGFTIAPATRETPGTDVVLHMKADAEEYLEPIRLETVVRKWADHVTVADHHRADGKDQPANEGTALWRKPKSE